jgi:hypothetical protein
VIGFNERFWPLMTLINIGVFFSTKINLYCHTNSLYMKHVDAYKQQVFGPPLSQMYYIW